jgi:hypothetical protein
MSHYRVRVKRADVEVEVDSSDKEYTESKLKELLGGVEIKETAPRASGKAGKVHVGAATGKSLSMAEYVRSVSPKSGSQYVVAVGDYLEKHGGMSDGFKTRDIVSGFTTIKYKHSNPAEAVRQAKSQGLLMDGKDGLLVVTSTAEAWVKTQQGAE